MAAIALTTAGRVEALKSNDQTEARMGYAGSAGDPVCVDSSGNWQLATGADATHSTGIHVLLASGKKGEYRTGLRAGDLEGFALSAMAYNAPVYVSDAGTLATTAGTVSVVVARVRPANGNVPAGSAPDKILRLVCPL